MFRFVMTASAALALAACSSGGAGDADTDGDGTYSEEEIAAATANLKTLDDGKFKMTIDVSELSDPAMSDQEAAQAKQFMEFANVAPAVCLTGETANKGMIDAASRMGQSDCNLDSFATTETSLDAKYSCDVEGQTGVMTVAGKIADASNEVTINVEGPSKVEGGTFVMTASVTTERVGDCDEGEEPIAM